MFVPRVGVPLGWNEDLFDREIRHAISVRRFAGGNVKRLLEVLRKADKELEVLLNDRLRQGMDPTGDRLQALLKDIRETRRRMWVEQRATTRTELSSFAQAEQKFALKMLQASIPVEINFATASAERLNALISGMPFGGGTNAARTLTQWFDSLGAVDQRRIIESLQLGVIQGETVPQMVARVRATQALTYRNAEAVVRTGVSFAMNRSREQFFLENDSVIAALRWTAVLDGRTSAICRARDGHFAPLEGTSTEGVPRPWLKPLTARPPAHPNERSLMTAALDSDGIADMIPDRPFVRDTRTRRLREMDFRADAKRKVGKEQWSQLDEAARRDLIREERRAWTRENVGTVKGDVNYDSWLRRQPESFQNEVLGKGKAVLFRKGLNLDKYIDREGAELTLGQLEELFPSYLQ